MRIRVNFVLRDQAWEVYCVSPGVGAPISTVVTVPDQAVLARLLRYVGATEAEIEGAKKNIQYRGGGGLFLELLPGRKNLLHIQPLWNVGLEP